MRSEVEHELARTLQAVFDAAPPPAPSVADGIQRVRRRRRRRRVSGAAGLLAVVVAAFGATAMIRPVGTGVADLAEAPDARQVWPEAVVTLPAVLSGDVEYTVQAALGDDVFLVTPYGRAPVLLTGSTGATRPLDGVFPGNELTQFDITPRYLLWSNVVKDGRDVYAQPRDGAGKAVHLGLIPAVDVAVAEVGGAFYATGTTYHATNQTHTLYRLSAGRAPVAVPSGAGYALTTGPWAVAGTPQPGTADRLPSVVRTRYLYRPLTVTRAAPSYWNVATGARVTPVNRAPIISCTPTVCVGTAAGALISWDADGSHELRATGFTTGRGDDVDAFFSSSGRFVQVVAMTAREPAEPTSIRLWDRATGQAATEPSQASRLAYDVAELGTTVDHKTVLDLTRIS
ncbi:hypothetical protein [Actinoplanes sp. NPDC049265]|uniref:hypothetical protein n=1 Tax=Actinoplanes sp. NPDC049265 TaxID=3363902 RepID=UPI00371457C6